MKFIFLTAAFFLQGNLLTKETDSSSIRESDLQGEVPFVCRRYSNWSVPLYLAWR